MKPLATVVRYAKCTARIYTKSAVVYNGFLHEFRTFDADENVKRMATDLQDTLLLTRIAGGDLTVLEAKYHLAF